MKKSDITEKRLSSVHLGYIAAILFTVGIISFIVYTGLRNQKNAPTEKDDIASIALIHQPSS